jgi:hypothetical protein
MFNFTKTRQQARQHLHDVLAAPVIYTRKSDDREFRITARLHRKVEAIGGDEGFAQMLVEQDRVVLQCQDVEEIGPAVGDTIFFKADQVTAVIETVEPAQYPTQICNVSLQ